MLEVGADRLNTGALAARRPGRAERQAAGARAECRHHGATSGVCRAPGSSAVSRPECRRRAAQKGSAEWRR